MSALNPISDPVMKAFALCIEADMVRDRLDEVTKRCLDLTATLTSDQFNLLVRLEADRKADKRAAS